MLQADSEKLRQAWIKAVQTSIATAYREKGDEAEVSRGAVRILGCAANALNFACNRVGASFLWNMSSCS